LAVFCTSTPLSLLPTDKGGEFVFCLRKAFAQGRRLRRFHAMVATVMVVQVAFATLLATAPRREGTLGKLRLGPIQRAQGRRTSA
ncbi:MAG: hypothetical protein ACUVTW_15805, partial [Thermogutta sp.]